MIIELCIVSGFWLCICCIIYFIMQQDKKVLLALLHKHTQLNVDFFNVKLHEQGHGPVLGSPTWVDPKQPPDEPI